MIPTFQLPARYAPRAVAFVLTRASYPGKGWEFAGRDHSGYIVPARGRDGLPFGKFKSRAKAAYFARAALLPTYATWNGRTRRYDGAAAVFEAKPRQDLPSPIEAPNASAWRV